MKSGFFLASLVLLCLLNRASLDKNLGRLQKISTHLESRVDSEDLDKNLAEARSLLELKLKRDTSIFRRKSSSTTINALKRFVALEKVLADTSLCGQYNHEILIAAGSLFDNIELDEDTVHQDGLGRLKRIVREAALQHAQKCLPKYQAIFDEKYSSMNMELVSKVGHLFSKAMDQKLIKYIGLHKDPNLKMIAPQGLFMRREGARLIYWTLQRLGDYDDININAIKCVNGIPRRKECDPLMVEGVKQLMIEHVIQPCEYFVDELAGLFSTAELDLRATKGLKLGNQLFNLAFTQLKLCNDLLSSDRSQAFHELIVLVEVQRKLDNR